MAKIVIPISNDRLSNQFKDCGYYNVFETDQEHVVSKVKETLCKTNLKELDNWLKEKGITDIITHKIDKSLVEYFSDTKVNLYVGVSINTADNLINDYLKGTLKSNTQLIS